MNDTTKDTFTLKVRKDVVLDIMNDKARFDDTLQIYEEEGESNKKSTYTKTVTCPACNHSFDHRNSTNTDNAKKNEKMIIYMMQVVIQKSHLPHKKLEAVIDGKRTVPFGQTNASDFTLRKDPERKAR